jgi:hypothetical protein
MERERVENALQAGKVPGLKEAALTDFFFFFSVTIELPFRFHM